MKKTALEVYALAVCFFAAAVFAVVLAAAVWDGVEWVAPEFAMNGRDYECHQTNAAFRDCRAEYRAYPSGAQPAPLPQGAALTQMREQSYRRQINAERRSAQQGLAQKTIVAIVMLALFMAHWHLRRAVADSR